MRGQPLRPAIFIPRHLLACSLNSLRRVEIKVANGRLAETSMNEHELAMGTVRTKNVLLQGRFSICVDADTNYIEHLRLRA